MERTQAGSAHELTKKARNSKISQKELERYLKQVLDVYCSKATTVVLKLCSSRTTRKRKRLLFSFVRLTVTCTRKSRQHHWEKTSQVWRTGNARFSSESSTHRTTEWENVS